MKIKIISVFRGVITFFIMLMGLLAQLIINSLKYEGFMEYWTIFSFFFISYVLLYYYENQIKEELKKKLYENKLNMLMI
jgi:uncharacterized membrane protein YbhN (UPF0104 family)